MIDKYTDNEDDNDEEEEEEEKEDAQAATSLLIAIAEDHRRYLPRQITRRNNETGTRF